MSESGRVSRIAGRYELGGPIGSGGTATVFRAKDIESGQDVAVKLVPPGDSADAFFERFRREALALSRVRSRYVTRVHDFGKDEEHGLYLVMELVDGIALDVKSIGRPLFPHEVLRIGREMLDGLAAAHAAGIVHLDLKPQNVLLQRGGDALRSPKIVDFGIARRIYRAQIDEALGKSEARSGMVWGTPAFMAPEQLVEAKIGPFTDVYAAGLVLFNLLAVGTLFPGEELRDQLRGRLESDPVVEGRVAPPLSAVLARMLARDPERRFKDAREAYETIADLDTAPVSIHSPPRLSDVPSSGKSFPLPPPVPSIAVMPVPAETARSLPSSKPPSQSSVAPPKLSRLSPEPEVALRETLYALDVAMLDALARREKNHVIGRIARAVSLVLRLELDAAALILEPLVAESAIARACGTSLVAPRARRMTRARVDPDRSDAWIDAVDVELAAILASIAAALAQRDDAARSATRAQKVLERALAGNADVPMTTLTTLKIAEIAARCARGASDSPDAIRECLAMRDAETAPPSPFDKLVRAVLLGTLAFRADEAFARLELERAAKLAQETGNVLFEARASVTLGGLLVEIPGRLERGLAVLERAITLLGHGEAPSLEHIAEHNRGAALIIASRWSEAAPHLQRAREAARGERSIELEMATCMNEAIALVCMGELPRARKVADELTDSRLGVLSSRTAALCHVARALVSLAARDLVMTDDQLAHARTRAAESGADAADAMLVSKVLDALARVLKGEDVDLMERAGDVEALAAQGAITWAYWFDIIRAALSRLPLPSRTKVEEARAKLALVLEPKDARRTSAPPPA